MSEASKKQTFLHGAALLAMATAVVKIIGAFYKIPLKMIIGDQGYGYFITAYDIYTVLLMISTAGLPIAMSRMISQASSLGKFNQVRRIYATARGIFLGLGIVSTGLMMGFSHQLAAFQKQPDAWAAIFCLGPCALLMCVMSTYRGFFQGQGNMRPTSNSQILEAFFKLVVGLVLAYAVMQTTRSVAYAAGAAILGVTVSCLVSSVYLNRQQRPAYRELPVTEDVPKSFGQTAKQLLAIAVPITIGSAGLQMLTVLETNLYMGQLLGSLGMTQSQADTTRGIYGMCQTVFNMPCAFIVPITVSIIPAVTSHLTLLNNKAAKATEESAARITGLISLPCSVGLAVLAEPVMSLLGGYSGEKLVLAASLMRLLGICVFLYAGVQLTNAIMQAHGYAHIPVVNMLLCGGMKLAVVYILVGNPNIGIIGAPLGAIVCYLCIALLNNFSISRKFTEKPAITSQITTGNHTGAKATEESAARITGLLSLPCAVGLTILAKPVMGLLGGYTGANLDLAGAILAVLGINVFFYGLIQYTNVVLQSHGYAHIPVINTLICGGMKLVIVYLLVGNPRIGIVGAPIGMLLCYLCIGVMNLIAIRKVVPQKSQILQNLLRPLLPAAFMGAAVWGIYRILIALLGADGSRIFLCGIPVAVGVAVYAVCIVVFKAIRREDCLLLPKGEKIAKLLRL